MGQGDVITCEERLFFFNFFPSEVFSSISSIERFPARLGAGDCIATPAGLVTALDFSFLFFSGKCLNRVACSGDWKVSMNIFFPFRLNEGGVEDCLKTLTIAFLSSVSGKLNVSSSRLAEVVMRSIEFRSITVDETSPRIFTNLYEMFINCLYVQSKKLVAQH